MIYPNSSITSMLCTWIFSKSRSLEKFSIDAACFNINVVFLRFKAIKKQDSQETHLNEHLSRVASVLQCCSALVNLTFSEKTMKHFLGQCISKPVFYWFFSSFRK